MEPIAQLFLAVGLAYLFLVGILYVGARIHFDSVSRWMQAAEQQMDTVRSEMDSARMHLLRSQQETPETEYREYEIAWSEASFDLGRH